MATITLQEAFNSQATEIISNRVRIAQLEAGSILNISNVNDLLAQGNYKTNDENVLIYQPIGDYYTRAEVITGYYNKDEMDTKLGGYMTKPELATFYQAKGNYLVASDLGDYLTRDKLNALITSGSQVDVYSKSEVAALIANSNGDGSGVSTGTQGEQGIQGEKGDKGDTGATGTVDTSNFYDKTTSDSRYTIESTLTNKIKVAAIALLQDGVTEYNKTTIRSTSNVTINRDSVTNFSRVYDDELITFTFNGVNYEVEITIQDSEYRVITFNRVSGTSQIEYLNVKKNDSSLSFQYEVFNTATTFNDGSASWGSTITLENISIQKKDNIRDFILAIASL